ncbi:GNAT family N-acetyltransferase [Acetobacter sicerae]|uniref:GNAT family N-acetyltransferase n=1 Tax=Acetobacter sicerae TaxID=85325 RepID=UPI00156B88B0|nr:GNAT family N-acetyltransferase [Acetobacter sicerae]NHN91101.1 GNAT family N-acetyltransferase [Acetobacter sicerae]
MIISAERLNLRPWNDADRISFVDMSVDPEVMEFMMPLKREAASGAWIDDQIAHQKAHGFCLWAVERKEDLRFIGTVGLRRIGYEADFTPAVEIGWRIARPFWGNGYAPEAATAAIQFGFKILKLPEIIAITVPHNLKSRRVMEKLGMQRDEDGDFDHPLVKKGHPLRRHVLYRLRRSEWNRKREVSDV